MMEENERKYLKVALLPGEKGSRKCFATAASTGHMQTRRNDHNRCTPSGRRVSVFGVHASMNCVCAHTLLVHTKCVEISR